MKILILIVLLLTAIFAASKSLEGIDGKERYIRFGWILLYGLLFSVFSNLTN